MSGRARELGPPAGRGCPLGDGRGSAALRERRRGMPATGRADGGGWVGVGERGGGGVGSVARRGAGSWSVTGERVATLQIRLLRALASLFQADADCTRSYLATKTYYADT